MPQAKREREKLKMPVHAIITTEDNKKTNEIITIRDCYSDDVKELITITKEQKILLDWLIDNDYISRDYYFEEGLPKVTDLTI